MEKNIKKTEKRNIEELKALLAQQKKELVKKTKALEKAKEREMILKIREWAKTEDAERRLKELEDTRKALLNILEDVEEAQKRAEEEKEKTEAVITNLTDGLFVFDVEGRVSMVNPQAEIFFGIKRQAVEGMSVSDFKKIPTLAGFAELIGNGIKKVFREEIKINDQTLEVTTVPVIHKEKKLGTLAIIHDISREKLVEQMKTEFVSIAAHQLRTPLSAIKWSISLLKERISGDKDTEDLLEKLNQSNERMIRLIDDLLNVTRIEEGRYVYKPVPKDIVQIVESVITPRMEIAKRKSIDFSFEKPAEKIPKVMVDEEKISIVIQNLVENAINYTPSNGRVSVLIKYQKEVPEILVEVKDTGIGIPKSEQQRIFSKFFRGSNAIKSETEGTGLGLFIAKNIIEAHHGKIWFESEKDKGTTFYFTLPVSNQ